MTEQAAKADTPLTEKQLAFAITYVETGNAAQAYRTAYDVADDAKDSWIYVEANQLLDHPKIAPKIVSLRQAADERDLYRPSGICSG